MKSEQIIDALGQIDDRLVLDILPERTRRKKPIWPMFATAAAMAAVCWLAFSWCVAPETVETPELAVSEEPSVAEIPERLPPLPVNEISFSEPELYYVTAYDKVETPNVLQFYPSLSDLDQWPDTMPVFMNKTEDENAVLAHTRELLATLGLNLDVTLENGQAVASDPQNGITVMTVDDHLNAILLQPEYVGLTFMENVYEDDALSTFAETICSRDHPAMFYEDYPSWDSILVTAFDHSGQLSQWLPQLTLGGVQFTIRDGWITEVQIPGMPLSSHGDYPVLTPEEALEALHNGCGLTSIPEEYRWEELQVESMGMTYLDLDQQACYLPYYWFLVRIPDSCPYAASKTGTDAFTRFYVPAVEPQFLGELPSWKSSLTADDLDWDEIRNAVYMAYDPNGVGDEAKEAVFNFLQTLPERDLTPILGGKWTWGIGESADQYFASLQCREPHLTSMGASCSFHYFFDTGEVQWGPSGAWAGDLGSDLPEAIRLELSSSGDTAHLREAFAIYFAKNREELQYLPQMTDADPDWDELTRFVLENAGTTPISREAFAEMVHHYFGELAYVDGSSSFLHFDDAYYDAYETEQTDGLTFYRLDHAEQVEDNLWMAVFTGFDLAWTDFHPGYESPASENYTTIMQRVPWEAETTDLLEPIVQVMADERTLEEQGLKASEHLIVTFRLTDGEHPFQYVSCERLPE